jgi:hypothetical protein
MHLEAKVILMSLLTLLWVSLMTAQSQERITNILNDQINQWNEGNIEGFMQGYWKSDSLKFITKNGINLGWQAVYERYLNAYPSKERMGKLAFSDLNIDELSESLAFVTGSWKLEFTDKPKSGGWFSLVFKLLNGQWFIVADHTSG